MPEYESMAKLSLKRVEDDVIGVNVERPRKYDKKITLVQDNSVVS